MKFLRDRSIAFIACADTKLERRSGRSAFCGNARSNTQG
jgi:hypothetical protein